MIAWILVVLLTLVGGTGWYLFYRSAKALFVFDMTFDRLLTVLSSYSEDLGKMTQGDLLLDHPEVRAFHKRNILAFQEINEVVEDIKRGRPEGPKETGPRPDVG